MTDNLKLMGHQFMISLRSYFGLNRSMNFIVFKIDVEDYSSATQKGLSMLNLDLLP